MELNVETKNSDGSISFKGTLNKKEIDFVLNVGINFLLAQGVAPFLAKDGQQQIVMPEPTTKQ